MSDTMTHEEALKKLKALGAVPYDPRFPNQNQTKNCYQNYLDYHRCRKIKGEDYKPCEWYKKAYVGLCPELWYDKWDSQREQGIFAGDI